LQDLHTAAAAAAGGSVPHLAQHCLAELLHLGLLLPLLLLLYSTWPSAVLLLHMLYLHTQSEAAADAVRCTCPSTALLSPTHDLHTSAAAAAAAAAGSAPHLSQRCLAELLHLLLLLLLCSTLHVPAPPC
jgi:hypothetical protein